jgi:hypothetical protein
VDLIRVLHDRRHPPSPEGAFFGSGLRSLSAAK